MAEHTRRLGALRSTPPDPERWAYVREMLRSKHEGLQSGALKVLAAWATPAAKLELQSFLSEAFSRPKGSAIRGVAVAGLAPLLTLADESWLAELGRSRSALERHELRKLRWKLEELQRKQRAGRLEGGLGRGLGWLRRLTSRLGARRLGGTMTDERPGSSGDLLYPWMRQELGLYLRELATPDPRPSWKDEAQRGLVSGIDQVIHFFFDDHDFGEADVGKIYFDVREVEAVGALKAALDRLIDKMPAGGDDDYVEHAEWAEVTAAACRALEILEGRSPLG